MSIFQLVSAMNAKFGNPMGNYQDFVMTTPIGHVLNSEDADRNIALMHRLKKYTKGVESELIELHEKIAKHDLEEVRDALCDIIVFAYGGLHELGVDGDEDMRAVLKGVMSRFCKDENQLEKTIEMYVGKGVETYSEGSFPFVCVKSAKDQQMPEYPKGKFLKPVGVQKPVFNPNPLNTAGLKKSFSVMCNMHLEELVGKTETPAARAPVLTAFPAAGPAPSLVDNIKGGAYDYSSIVPSEVAPYQAGVGFAPIVPTEEQMQRDDKTFEEQQAEIVAAKHRPMNKAAQVTHDMGVQRAENTDKEARWKAFVASSLLRLEEDLAKLHPQQQEVLLNGEYIVTTVIKHKR